MKKPVMGEPIHEAAPKFGTKRRSYATKRRVTMAVVDYCKQGEFIAVTVREKGFLGSTTVNLTRRDLDRITRALRTGQLRLKED